jgi:hypothetical protein
LPTWRWPEKVRISEQRGVGSGKGIRSRQTSTIFDLKQKGMKGI